MEASLLIYRANQWTGFYMIGSSVMKELKSTWCLSDGNPPTPVKVPLEEKLANNTYFPIV